MNLAGEYKFVSCAKFDNAFFSWVDLEYVDPQSLDEARVEEDGLFSEVELQHP